MEINGKRKHRFLPYVYLGKLKAFLIELCQNRMQLWRGFTKQRDENWLTVDESFGLNFVKRVTLIFVTAEKFLNLQFAVLNADVFLIIVCAVTLPFHMAQLVEVGRFNLLIIDVDNPFQRKTRKTRGEILHFLRGVLICNIVLLKCTCLSNRGSNGVSKAFNLCLGFVSQKPKFQHRFFGCQILVTSKFGCGRVRVVLAVLPPDFRFPHGDSEDLAVLFLGEPWELGFWGGMVAVARKNNVGSAWLLRKAKLKRKKDIFMASRAAARALADDDSENGTWIQIRDCRRWWYW